MAIEYQYEVMSIEYEIKQAAFLPVQGVGINGSFFLKGTITIRENLLYISAMGFTAAQFSGDVRFSMEAKLIINNIMIAETYIQRGTGVELWPFDGKYKPVGSASFTLPPLPSDSLPTSQLILIARYIYSSSEGSAAPMPHSGKKIIQLNIKATS